MKTALRQRIIDYLKQWHEYDHKAFVNGGEIERLALEAGYKASNASRRLRELENEGIIEKRGNYKGHVEYRYVSDPVSVIWRETEKMHAV